MILIPLNTEQYCFKSCDKTLIEQGLCSCNNRINFKNQYMENSEELKNPTLGEQRVRTDFNVSQEDIVTQLKQKSAELIDLCETLKVRDGRLASLAQTSYEEAAMWAVKAATA